ncbi:hypothetical protein G7Z17_g13187 [Cylindrodendrum hubeiense]|uniref:DUF7924 domain-containing protein n=1 Tax=Cylindrodendrum hubeiense TaxID=595255 RepID=A0A9P5GXJ4_9HYPO|nr:hypothetical protein G7Z17_g13187 [Cylindrodendrum hubeiense]
MDYAGEYLVVGEGSTTGAGQPPQGLQTPRNSGLMLDGLPGPESLGPVLQRSVRSLLDDHIPQWRSSADSVGSSEPAGSVEGAEQQEVTQQRGGEEAVPDDPEPISSSSNTVEDALPRDSPVPGPSNGQKRPVETECDQGQKRLRTEFHTATTLSTASPGNAPYHVAKWVTTGVWPKIFFHPDGPIEPSNPFEHLLAKAKRLLDLDQMSREEKNAVYKNPRCELLMQAKGIFMEKYELDIPVAAKELLNELLNTARPVPVDTIFDAGLFETVFRNLRCKGVDRVIQDIARLIVPSVETLALRDDNLRHLAESVNEGWDSSFPLFGNRPQPDYSVGFKREAFTHDQLAKLAPFVGSVLGNDQSFFLATDYMYFPFLTCEMACGAAGLDVADRQNAHSTTLAVRAVVELFRSVKREGEVHRQILAFSVSHDDRLVRIYGYYPVLFGSDTWYCRQPMHAFDLTAQDGKERWRAYHFTENVYHMWARDHLDRIRSVVDDFPEPRASDSEPGSP